MKPGGRAAWLAARWRQVWFEPGSALNLGACRVLFFGGLLLISAPRDFRQWAEVSSVFWFPISLFQHLRLPLLPSHLLSMLQLAWKLSLGLSCVGFLTRASTAVAFLLGTYLLGLPHNFGETSHGDAILVLALGVMALSRCGDRLSVDAVIRTAMRRGAAGTDRWEAPAIPAGEYAWPVRLVWLAMVFVFLAAGVSKLRHAGLGWVTSDTLAAILTASHYHISNGDPLTRWGLRIAQCGWLCRALAAATLAIELGFPLALLSRKARRVVLPAAFIMQVAFRILMGPVFDGLMLCYLFWIPWDHVGRSLSPRRSGGDGTEGTPAAGTLFDDFPRGGTGTPVSDREPADRTTARMRGATS